MIKTLRTPTFHAPAEGTLAPRGFEMRRVATREDWADVKALRFEFLRERGDIPESPDGAYGDDHDAAFNTTTFLLSRNGRLVGSTRSSVSSAQRRWPLPAGGAYASEIAALGADATLVEASLMVVDPASALDPKTALFHLFKAHMLQCAAENADWLIVAVRDSQIGFYRRMFNMEILSGAERYAGLSAPRVLMGLEYHAQAQLLFMRMPMLAVSDADERDFAASGVITFPDARRAAPKRGDSPYIAAGD
ncbi:MAG: N-acyl amino acid synthase FeeM domain-containing protein [Usitatibacter sp.]